MASVKRKKRIDLSKEEKLLLLREVDKNKNVSEACRKFGVVPMAYYRAKDKYGDEYLKLKEKEDKEGRLGLMENVVLESNKNRMVAENKARDTILLALEIIDEKLKDERSRMEGDPDIQDKVPFKDIVAFFEIAAPYVLETKSDNNNNKTPKNLMQHHQYITNILNQQKINVKGGNKANNNQGNLPEPVKE